MPLLTADIINDGASAELKRTWRELARAYFIKYYPCISLEGGENNENPEWAACSWTNIGRCDLPNTKDNYPFDHNAWLNMPEYACLQVTTETNFQAQVYHSNEFLREHYPKCSSNM